MTPDLEKHAQAMRDQNGRKVQGRPINPSLYDCGYDPSAHSYKETVKHWAQCSNEQCQQSNRNHALTKRYFMRRTRLSPKNPNAQNSGISR